MEEPGVQADRRDEHGQVVLVLVLWITAGLAGLALVAVWSAGAARSGRAQTVADAVALAEGAATFANPPADADAVTVQRVGNRIRVTAQVGRQVAHAEVLVQTSPTQRRHGLAPSMVAAVARAEQLLGVPLDIRSGHRSREEQQRHRAAEYQEQTARRSERARLAETFDKSGVATGAHALHPGTGDCHHLGRVF